MLAQQRASLSVRVFVDDQVAGRVEVGQGLRKSSRELNLGSYAHGTQRLAPIFRGQLSSDRRCNNAHSPPPFLLHVLVSEALIDGVVIVVGVFMLERFDLSRQGGDPLFERMLGGGWERGDEGGEEGDHQQNARHA